MRIGLLGGTFDPIHFGHLRAAEEVLEGLGLDEIWFVPSFLPPHKESRKITPYHHRFAMTEIAVSGISHFKLSDMEAKRGGPSYTIDTLRGLEKIHGKDHEFFFIVGMDAFLEIDTWKSYRELVSYASLVVMKRDQGGWEAVKEKVASIYIDYKYDKNNAGATPCGCPVKSGRYLSRNGRSIYLLTVTNLSISSTIIRQKIGQGLSINFLAPKDVIKYLEVNGLYKKNAGATPCGSLSEKKDKAVIDALPLRIAEELDANKGENILILDVRGQSAFTDYFVITHGRSKRHVQGMADKLEAALKKKEGIRCKAIEGSQEGSWILMDYGDVIVHLFLESVREFYDIEGLWSQAQRLEHPSRTNDILSPAMTGSNKEEVS